PLEAVVVIARGWSGQIKIERQTDYRLANKKWHGGIIVSLTAGEWRQAATARAEAAIRPAILPPDYAPSAMPAHRQRLGGPTGPARRRIPRWRHGACPDPAAAPSSAPRPARAAGPAGSD